MPKLRNGGNDIEKLTQWIGRKCKNHHPLEELKLPGSAQKSKPNVYQRGSEASAVTLADDRSVLLYTQGGRTFEVTVSEIDGEKYHDRKKIAVGL